MTDDTRRPVSVFREFLDGEASGGIILIAAAALALIVANSPLADVYFRALHAYLGPLSLLHWINDGLMAVFFLLVGLEIKREMLDGQLSTWPRRALPGIAAAGGMAVPALVYAAINRENGPALAGWAVPTATDIAFALGVLSLLGNRVPTSLKVFLTALAIIDDLGAVVIIALFYTSGLSPGWLAAAFAVVALLAAINRMGVTTPVPYVVLGVVLWVFVLKSGVHATLAGVALALTVPLKASPGLAHDPEQSTLHRLEHALHKVVPFAVVPVFGFANAGVSLAGVGPADLVEPLTLGVTAGLVVGKLVGVFGASALAVGLRIAELPRNAGWLHMVGIALLCGIGFTMSLFIGLLAFASNEALQDAVKLGILAGSLIAAVLGAALLLAAPTAVNAGQEE